MSMEAASTTVAATPAPISVLTTARARAGPTRRSSGRSPGWRPASCVLIALLLRPALIEARPPSSRRASSSFVFTNDWVPSQNAFGALPLLVGHAHHLGASRCSSACRSRSRPRCTSPSCAPARVRQPLTILVELLAAVPSVVYGLWGIFFLAPKLQPAEQWFADTFSFLPFVGGHGRRSRTTSSPG